MLCVIASEDQRVINTLSKQLDSLDLQYIVFYNSVVALSHLQLFKPDYVIIEDSACSFISLQSFIKRFQLYDESLSHLIIISNENKEEITLQRTNIVLSPEELSSTLAKLMERHSRTTVLWQDTSAKEQTTFFFVDVNDPNVPTDRFPILNGYLIRIHFCLICANQTDLLKLIEQLFYVLNSYKNQELYQQICNSLEHLLCDVQNSLLSVNLPYHEPLFFQDIFQSLTHYKKRFFNLSAQIFELFYLRHQALDKLVNYIAEHYEQPLTLSFLSQKFGFSSSYLSHIFKEHTGMALSNFINLARIHQACCLLESTNMPVNSISYQVGYSDSKYFSRIFKSLTLIAPSKYRSQHTKLSLAMK